MSITAVAIANAARDGRAGDGHAFSELIEAHAEEYLNTVKSVLNLSKCPKPPTRRP